MAEVIKGLLDSWDVTPPSGVDTFGSIICSMNSVDLVRQIIPSDGSKWTVNHTKSLCYILTICPPDWLAPVGQEYTQSPDFRKTLSVLFTHIFQSSEIPERLDTEIYQYEERDFEGCAERSTCTMQFLVKFLQHLKNSNTEWLFMDLMKTGVKHVIILICANSERAPWTSSQSVQTAMDLKLALFDSYKCSNMSELLLACPDKCSNAQTVDNEIAVTGKGTVLYQTLEYLRPRLNKGKWKQNPPLLKVFVTCLLYTKLPHVGDFLCEFLPVILTLVDDHLTENKELGVKCLSHIIKNTSRTELVWQSRADVIYEAVKLQLYSKEVTLLEQTIPCMTAVLNVLEPQSGLYHSSETNADGPTKHDETFCLILTSAEMESRLALRRTYTKFLGRFIKQMGISVVKHSRPLLRLIVSYLETYDGPSETARFQTLEVLDAFIIQAWPRIAYHSATILKSLVRLVYDISVDNTLTPVSVKQGLNDKARHSLLLLRKVCPTEVEDCLKKVLDIETTPQCEEVLKYVLSSNLPDSTV